MTLVLIGVWALFWRGWHAKIEVIWGPGRIYRFPYPPRQPIEIKAWRFYPLFFKAKQPFGEKNGWTSPSTFGQPAECGRRLMRRSNAAATKSKMGSCLEASKAVVWPSDQLFTSTIAILPPPKKKNPTASVQDGPKKPYTSYKWSQKKNLSRGV